MDSTQAEKKMRKVICVLKWIQSIRALNDEEPSTKAPTSLKTVEIDWNSYETEDDPDVTRNTSDVDPNINSGGPIITSILENIQVTPPKVKKNFVQYGGGYYFKHQWEHI